MYSSSIDLSTITALEGSDPVPTLEHRIQAHLEIFEFVSSFGQPKNLYACRLRLFQLFVRWLSHLSSEYGWFNSPTQVWPSGPMANPGGQEQLPDCLHLSIQAMSFDEHLIFSSAIRNIATRLTLDSTLRCYSIYSRLFMNSMYYRSNVLAFIRHIRFLFTISQGKPPVK